VQGGGSGRAIRARLVGDHPTLIVVIHRGHRSRATRRRLGARLHRGQDVHDREATEQEPEGDKASARQHRPGIR
jgi:hypothetical protein